MDTLQKILESTIKDSLTEEVISRIYLRKKAENLGISLTQQQLDDLIHKLLNSTNDTLEIDVIKNNITQKISLLDGEEDDVEQILRPVVNELTTQLMNSLKTSYARTLRLRLEQDSSRILRKRKKSYKEFDTELKQVWGKGLDLLELFLTLVLEAGDHFSEENRQESFDKQDLVFDAMARLHARACQISSEILTLIKAGFADGAHARWRSLHEVVVVFYFIKENGKEVAERYILHEAIESLKAAEEHQLQHIKLKRQAIPEEEINEMREMCNMLIEQYGPSFKGDYGWAAAALSMKKPTFKDIEESIKLSHLRPDYKHASINVHATSKALLSKLSLQPGNDYVLPTGPSVYGLVKPAHSLVVSLGQITTAFLLSKPNVDRLAICDFLLNLDREIADTFVDAEKKLFGFE